MGLEKSHLKVLDVSDLFERKMKVFLLNIYLVFVYLFESFPIIIYRHEGYFCMNEKPFINILMCKSLLMEYVYFIFEVRYMNV